MQKIVFISLTYDKISPMEGIEFDEDKSILAPMEPEEKIPDRGFEGWVYRKFPGTFKAKRVILLFLAFVLFMISFVFFIMARYNIVVNNSSESFNNRVTNTKLR